MREYRVIVVGAGHAGAEAAWAAANVLGKPSSVALVTLRADTIGVMSCNPAIGGLAKGQLVREIDAMGGLMGLAADAAGIHFKVLNTSKGPAVHGPRAQCDKLAYARMVRRLLAARPEIDLFEARVEEILVERGRIRGVRVCVRGGSEEVLAAPAVVLTTGTFMRGLMHEGTVTRPGGRAGEGPGGAIGDSLRALGFELGRLKTGTPPRVRRASIDWEGLEVQPGDEIPQPFSELTPHPLDGPDASSGWRVGEVALDRFPHLKQVECRQTRTTPAVHDLIRANLDRAPIFSGQVEGVGPRYCPSIEDKVVRFADRDAHGVFLEPESLETDWVYLNGVSTSLPRDVQEQMVRMLPGLERAEIVQFGYAVEYDMVRPHQIRASGETKRVAGLFLAGQINGTSGYEEAGAQGLIAGLNAARSALGLEVIILGREQAYIGVLMDDLVTKTPVEPYRMFTSRAEHRILLRADNAPDRLTPLARDAGLLDATELGRLRLDAFERRRREIDAIERAIEKARVDGEALARLVLRPQFGVSDLRRALKGIAARERSWFSVLADRKYAHYVERQRAEVRRHAQLERRRIPPDLPPEALAPMRAEAQEAMRRFTPETFGQARRLEGITPADLTLLSVIVERHRRRARAG